MKFEMEISEDMAKLLKVNDFLQEFERNAFLIYPYIYNGYVSLRKAAQIINVKDYLLLSQFYIEHNMPIYPNDSEAGL